MTSRRTVLVVDDQPDLLDAMAAALRRRGYHVVTANDGARAVELLGDELPDAAVIDMLLPGASGFVVTQAVKDLSDGRVPVVMVSGTAAAPHRDYALAAGVDHFLAKPFTTQKLVAAVEQFCPIAPAAHRSAPLMAGS